VNSGGRTSRDTRILLVAAALASCGALVLAALFLWSDPSDGSAGVREPRARIGPARASSSASDSAGVAGASNALDAPPGERESQGEHTLAPLAPLEVEVRTEDGVPVAQAVVALFRAEELLGRGLTDERGLAGFAASEGAGGALVLAPGSVPHKSSLSLAAGRTVIELPRGVRLTGRLRAGGGPPSSPVRLRLESDRPLVDLEGVPAAALDAVGFSGSDRLRSRVETDSEGEFVFTGLRLPWSGTLRLPERCWMTGTSSGARLDERTVRLDEPVEGLLIDMLELPQLTGKVVTARGGPGVPGARVDARVVFAEFTAEGERGRNREWDNGRSDDEGRFEVPVQPPRGENGEPLPLAEWPRIQRIDLRVASENQSRPKSVRLEGEHLPAGWELGEIELAPLRRIEFLVRDGAGQPLQGAVAYLRATSEPTDAEGRGHLDQVPIDPQRMVVGRAGFGEQVVPVAPDVAMPIEVTLKRVNRAELLCARLDGRALENVVLELSSSAPLFASRKSGRPAETHLATGDSACVNSWNTADTWVSQFRTDARGRVVLSDVLANTPIAVKASDVFGQTLGQQTITIGDGEERTFEILLSSQAGEFSGTVADENGLALAGADVQLSAVNPLSGGGMRSFRSRTDASGRFVFEAVLPARARIDIRREGFSPLQVEDVEVPPQGPPPVFRLSRALRLVVRAMDEAGRAVAVTSMNAVAEGHPTLTGQRRAIDRFEFRSLPPTFVEVQAVIGGRDYNRQVDPLLGDTALVVPAHGSADVRLVSEQPLGGRHRILVVERGASRFALRLNTQAGEAGEHAVFSALLPGEYTAILETAGDGRGGRWQRTGKGARFTVAANEQVDVELRP
jgi:carboxypeptidase family protein